MDISDVIRLQRRQAAAQARHTPYSGVGEVQDMVLGRCCSVAGALSATTVDRLATVSFYITILDSYFSFSNFRLIESTTGDVYASNVFYSGELVRNELTGSTSGTDGLGSIPRTATTRTTVKTLLNSVLYNYPFIAFTPENVPYKIRIQTDLDADGHLVFYLTCDDATRARPYTNYLDTRLFGLAFGVEPNGSTVLGITNNPTTGVSGAAVMFVAGGPDSIRAPFSIAA